MPNEQRYRVLCRLPGPNGKPCGKEICTAPQMTVPEMGEIPDKNAQALVQAIMGHMQKKHEMHLAGMMGAWQQFLGFNSLGYIMSEDPKVMEFMAVFGSQLRRMVCPPVSDSDIEAIVAGIGFTMEDPLRAKTLQALKNFRDLFTKPIQAQSASIG